VAFEEVGLPLRWEGQGADERGVEVKTGRVLVRVDPRYFRPTEVDLLIGDPAKAERRLGWKHETTWREIVAEMVREDLVATDKERRRHDD
jgi:GDPmannose 4,6-dehydratase